MTSFTPSESYLVSIKRPHCANSGMLRMLVRIAPTSADQDRRTFECASCGHTEVTVVKTVTAPYRH